MDTYGLVSKMKTKSKNCVYSAPLFRRVRSLELLLGGKIGERLSCRYLLLLLHVNLRLTKRESFIQAIRKQFLSQAGSWSCLGSHVKEPRRRGPALPLRRPFRHSSASQNLGNHLPFPHSGLLEPPSLQRGCRGALGPDPPAFSGVLVCFLLPPCFKMSEAGHVYSKKANTKSMHNKTQSPLSVNMIT